MPYESALLFFFRRQYLRVFRSSGTTHRFAGLR